MTVAFALAFAAGETPASHVWIADANILTPYRRTLDAADVRRRRTEGEFDVPRALEGGLGLASMGMLVPSEHYERGDAKEVADERLEGMLALIRETPELVLVRTPDEVARAPEREGSASRSRSRTGLPSERTSRSCGSSTAAA